MLKLIALPLVVYWFWFTEISLAVAAASTAVCAVIWRLQSYLMLNSRKHLGSPVAGFWLMVGALGTVIGVLTIIYQLGMKVFAD